ncbi:hypothetical protein E4T56_gene15321, partial [Termitomyces sp. T112]
LRVALCPSCRSFGTGVLVCFPRRQLSHFGIGSWGLDNLRGRDGDAKWSSWHLDGLRMHVLRLHRGG